MSDTLTSCSPTQSTEVSPWQRPVWKKPNDRIPGRRIQSRMFLQRSDCVGGSSLRPSLTITPAFNFPFQDTSFFKTPPLHTHTHHTDTPHCLRGVKQLQRTRSRIQRQREEGVYLGLLLHIGSVDNWPLSGPYHVNGGSGSMSSIPSFPHTSCCRSSPWILLEPNYSALHVLSTSISSHRSIHPAINTHNLSSKNSYSRVRHTGQLCFISRLYTQNTNDITHI